MTEPIIAKRLVYHIGGYDFTMPVDAVHRRFARELRRFEQAWSAKSVVSPPVIGPDTAAWDVVTTGPNWRVATHYQFVRWDDLIEAAGDRPLWRRVPLGLLAGLDFRRAVGLFPHQLALCPVFSLPLCAFCRLCCNRLVFRGFYCKSKRVCRPRNRRGTSRFPRALALARTLAAASPALR